MPQSDNSYYRPENNPAKYSNYFHDSNNPAIKPNDWDEYMELSQEIENSGVKYFASLSEKQFLDTILSYLNDPTSRDSMRIATAREAIIQRQIGLK